MKRFIVACFAFAALAGCDKSTTSAADAAVAAPSASTAASAAASASAADSAQAAAGAMPGVVSGAGMIPPPERAENKAAREITKANYKAELDSLEKEIGKD